MIPITIRCPYCMGVIVTEPLQPGDRVRQCCQNPLCNKIILISMEPVAKKSCDDNHLEHMFETRGNVGKCCECGNYAWQNTNNGLSGNGYQPTHSNLDINNPPHGGSAIPLKE